MLVLRGRIASDQTPNSKGVVVVRDEVVEVVSDQLNTPSSDQEDHQRANIEARSPQQGNWPRADERMRGAFGGEAKENRAFPSEPTDEASSLASTRFEGPLDHVDQVEVLLPHGWWIAPGFIDLHVHGGQGHDVVDGSAEALAAIGRIHASHGTTAFCPTVLASPARSMLRALETIALVARGDQQTAQLLGAHLEGPFLNPVRAGAQPRDALRSPDLALMKELYAAAAGCLSIVTLAPELPGAMDLIEWLVERGVVVSIGHSDATYEQCRAAIAAGCRLATHTFNAMSPLHHRRPGVVGAVLTNDEVVAEVIADGVHVSAPTLSLLRRAKGTRGVCLVTDCTAALDSDVPRLGDQPVEVVNGVAQLADGTLAGSVLTMERAVTNYVALAGASEQEAIGAATRVPARVLGRSDIGALGANKRADIVILDAALKVRATIVAGRVVAGALPKSQKFINSTE